MKLELVGAGIGEAGCSVVEEGVTSHFVFIYEQYRICSSCISFFKRKHENPQNMHLQTSLFSMFLSALKHTLIPIVVGRSYLFDTV